MTATPRRSFAVVEIDASDPREPLAYVHAFRLPYALATEWAVILREINRCERRAKIRNRWSFHVIDAVDNHPNEVTLFDNSRWFIPPLARFAAVHFDMETVRDAVVTFPESIVPRLGLPDKKARKARICDFFCTVQHIQTLLDEYGGAAVEGCHDHPTRCWTTPDGPDASAEDDDDDEDASDDADGVAATPKDGGAQEEELDLDLSLGPDFDD